MITAVIIIIGLLLRLNGYIVNRSLWLDEACLALNIVNKNIPEFLKDLDYYVVAPFGFSSIEKIIISLFGNNEYSLRLLLLMAGLASVLLFYQFSKKFLNPKALLFAVGLFSFSRPLIFYSSEAKQYNIDVVIALILYLLAVKKSPSLKHALFFLIFGSLSVWISHPAIFIIASIIIYKIFSSPKKNDFLMIFSWILSFSLYYFLSIRSLHTPVSTLHWQETFASLNPTWYPKALLDIFESPLDLFFPPLGALAFLIGCVTLLLKDKKSLLLLTAPIFFALFASFLHRYPFSDRLLLFLTPSFFLIIAKGIETLHSFAIVLILLPQVFLSVQALFSPHLIEETRPLITYWKANRQKDDIIYIYYASVCAFKYYAPEEFSLPNTIIGISARDNPALYEKDLEKLKGNPSVWLLFSHIFENEEKSMTSYLNKTGKNLKSLHAPGASLYHYALNP